MKLTLACRAPALISQEEKDAEKAALQAVDTRPIKKVAEAKARKRKRMQVTTDVITPIKPPDDCWLLFDLFNEICSPFKKLHRFRLHDRFVLIGLCWLYGRSASMLQARCCATGTLAGGSLVSEPSGSHRGWLHNLSMMHAFWHWLLLSQDVKLSLA